ncbi:Antibiotic biosynthesis monooxygenase OS=Lysinibacillus sphaericus OX=1421 GN=hmoA PE=4 SV=1 [Lysinibacillus sphaericus]
MFVQIKRMVVTEGNANKVVERFGAKKDAAITT